MSRQFLKTAASRTATAIGAATVAAVVVAGSLSVAQAATEAIPNNSVTSAKIVNGTIQGIDIKPGAVGPGQLGVNARPRWAKVDAGATTSLIRGRGAVSASRIGAGVYAVTFASPITNCGWTATLNDNDAGGSSARRDRCRAGVGRQCLHPLGPHLQQRGHPDRYQQQ